VHWTWLSCGAVLLATLPAGCATAPLPPERLVTTADLPSLAGVWDGWVQTSRGDTTLVSVIVQPDGSFVTRERAGGLDHGQMTVTPEGKMAFESFSATGFLPHTTGLLMLREGNGRRVLVGEGRATESAIFYTVELTQRR
jgi:hypothetical protein